MGPLMLVRKSSEPEARGLKKLGDKLRSLSWKSKGSKDTFSVGKGEESD